MGVQGSATCVMNLDDARGGLIGEPHRGLNAMFVMMNSARLGVGMPSLGLSEIANQQALNYARDRLQMPPASDPVRPGQPADPIIVPPAVRRRLHPHLTHPDAGLSFLHRDAPHTEAGRYRQ